MRKGTAQLTKLLEKRGINSVEDLSPEERVVFDRYKSILTGDVVTIDSIKAFCVSQIRIIENKIADGITMPTMVQVASLHVYINLLKAIEAPEAERESMELHLNQMLHET